MLGRGSKIETWMGVNIGGLCLGWTDDLDGFNDLGIKWRLYTGCLYFYTLVAPNAAHLSSSHCDDVYRERRSGALRVLFLMHSLSFLVVYLHGRTPPQTYFFQVGLVLESWDVHGGGLFVNTSPFS